MVLGPMWDGRDGGSTLGLEGDGAAQEMGGGC